MEKDIINVSDNSNIEINEESIELLLQCVCKSYICEDFRDNKCRMSQLIEVIEKDNWVCSHTWETPSKFLLHVIKYSENAPSEAVKKMEELQSQWSCLASEESCNCEFFDEMKRLKLKLEELADKPE